MVTMIASGIRGIPMIVMASATITSTKMMGEKKPSTPDDDRIVVHEAGGLSGQHGKSRNATMVSRASTR